MCFDEAEDNLHSMFNLKFRDKGGKPTQDLIVNNYHGRDMKSVKNKLCESHGAWD